MTTASISHPPAASQFEPRRFIVLGASNVARGFSALFSAVGRAWGWPLELLAAFGRGRSYGLPRGLPWHTLPGIADCGLWQTLAGRPRVATAGLLTDVGNDILYEAPVPQIAGWVEACLDRLQQAEARVVMTTLPLCSIEHLSPARFLLARSLIFPRSQLSHAVLMDRARDLDHRLRTLARQRGVLLAEQQARWYGLDPIHVRGWLYPRAWREILSMLGETMPTADGSTASCPWFRLLRYAPERYWLFGSERQRAQPVARWANGSTLALY